MTSKQGHDEWEGARWVNLGGESPLSPHILCWSRIEHDVVEDRRLGQRRRGDMRGRQPSVHWELGKPCSTRSLTHLSYPKYNGGTFDHGFVFFFYQRTNNIRFLFQRNQYYYS